MARDIRPRRDEVAVVYTSKIVVDGDGHVYVEETMNTPFNGPGARRRAEAFMKSEKDRDFTEDNGWQWHVWASPKANEVYGREMTDALLGRD